MRRADATSFVAAFAVIAALTACSDAATDTASSSSGAGASNSSSAAGDGAASASSSASTQGSGVGGAQDVAQCPVAHTVGIGTNTVVRVQSVDPIDMATVAASSLTVSLGNVSLPGSIEADAHSFTFLPQDPLPPGQLIEVVLSPAVLDDKGRALADVLGSWSFTTASGPGAGAGFKFADPQSPPLGDHAPSFAMTMDGEHPILAWGAGAGLVSVEHDGTSFMRRAWPVAAAVDRSTSASARARGA